MRAWNRRLAGWLGLAVTAGLLGCSQYQAFDTSALLEKQLGQRLDPELRAEVHIPFELDDEVLAAVDRRLTPAGSEKVRTDDVLAFIFGWLDLKYSLNPTRDAAATFRSHEGNCLSFVNLFVGVARHQRLNPFYVEVQDYQRWNYQEGVVVSRGHIVAGLYIDGKLSTFDFLPYRTKSYRDFKPIDDLTAIAHYYNNLGAEALLRGDLDEAERKLRIATSLAPDFDKAINNLGVVYLRTGRAEQAIEILQRGLETDPENVPLLTNLARGYQDLGRTGDAQRLLELLEHVNQANPFFFVYRGEWALGQGNLPRALDYMRQALRTDSELPEVHVGLAKVYLALGDLQKAGFHVERALKLDATHPEARKLARLLAAGSAASSGGALEPPGGRSRRPPGRGGSRPGAPPHAP